ncbi:MAG: hypothetical protein JWN70_3944 [Planctomycetaceae bacterium]|nr:hypothetical protein [Planctomycetaceae bacterium]
MRYTMAKVSRSSLRETSTTGGLIWRPHGRSRGVLTQVIEPVGIAEDTGNSHERCRHGFHAFSASPEQITLPAYVPNASALHPTGTAALPCSVASALMSLLIQSLSLSRKFQAPKCARIAYLNQNFS